MRDYLRGLPVFAGPLPIFDPSAAPATPEELFVEWLIEAVDAGIREPHAMTLSTVGADGVPSARVLILKNVDRDGWEFAVHANSPKGRELAGHGSAALTFHWREQGRQIRVRGRARPMAPERSAADFLARPAASRAEASLGRQSRPLHDREELERAVKGALETLTDDQVTPEWTLYALTADEVEFWQADQQRKHTRLRYARDGAGWTRTLLWP